MYTISTDLSNISNIEFSNLLLSQSASITDRIKSLTDLLSKSASKFRQARATLVEYLSSAAANVSSSVDLSPLAQTSIPVYLDSAKTKITYIPLDKFAAAVASNLAYDSDSVNIALDDSTTVQVSQQDILERLSAMADISSVQADAMEACLCDSSEDACSLMTRSLDNVSSVCYESLSAVVDDTRRFFTTSFAQGKQALALRVISTFGLDSYQDAETTVKGASATNVWAGITSFSAWSNFLGGVGAAASWIGSFVGKTIAQIFNFITSILQFVISAVKTIIKWAVTTIDKFIFKSTVGTAIQAEGHKYGWSSRYARTFTIYPRSYVAWYFYTHDYLDGDGLVISMFNVRLNIKYKSNTNNIPKTISYDEFMRSSYINEPFVLVGQLTVAPIDGPKFFSFCKRLGDSGLFDRCSAAVRIASKQDDVSRGAYMQHSFRPWTLSTDDVACFIDIMSQFSLDDLLPDGDSSTRDVALSFIYGNALGNLALAVPMDKLSYSPASWSVESLDRAVSNWICLFLQQFYCWGCVNVGPSGGTNVMSRTYDGDIPYYKPFIYPIQMEDWHSSYFACVPWDNYALTNKSINNFLGSCNYDGGNVTWPSFASNVWFAMAASQLRDIHDLSSNIRTDDIVTFKNTWTDLDRWEGASSYQLFGFLSGAINSTWSDDWDVNAYRYGLVDRIFIMIKRAWDSYSYPGTFGAFNNRPTATSDNEYYILTDKEEADTVAAYMQKVAGIFVATAVTVAVSIIGFKAFQAVRRTSLLADGAGFSYADALLRGDTEGAASYLRTYKKCKRSLAIASVCNPMNVVKALSSVSLPSVGSSVSVSDPANLDVILKSITG